MKAKYHTTPEQQAKPSPPTCGRRSFAALAIVILLSGALAGCVGEKGEKGPEGGDWQEWFLQGDEVPDGLYLCEPGGLSELKQGFETNPGQAQFDKDYGVYYQAFTPAPNVECDDWRSAEYYIEIRIDHDPRELRTAKEKVAAEQALGYCDGFETLGTKGKFKLYGDPGIQVLVSVQMLIPLTEPQLGFEEQREWDQTFEPIAEASRHQVFQAMDEKHPDWLDACGGIPDDEEDEGGDGPGDPPGNNETNHPDNVTEPGDFAIVDEGSGRAWDGPTWSPGDWWNYVMPNMACHPDDPYTNQRIIFHILDQDVINGTDPDSETPIYHREARSSSGTWAGTGCGIGSDWDNAGDNGWFTLGTALGWWLLFPLKDGKQWVHHTGTTLEHVDVAYVGTYEAGGQTYEATWRVTADPEDDEPTIIHLDEDVGWWVTVESRPDDQADFVLLDWHRE